MAKIKEHPEDPREPEIDESGVDLAQIRQMLDLTPAERLETIAQFANSLWMLRTRDEEREPG